MTAATMSPSSVVTTTTKANGFLHEPTPTAYNALKHLHITSPISGATTPTLSSQSYESDDMDMDDYDEEDEDEDEDDDKDDGVSFSGSEEDAHDDKHDGGVQLQNIHHQHQKHEEQKSSHLHVQRQHLDLKIDESTDTAPLDRTLSISPSSKKLKIQDFELLKTLGTGTFARVWLVRPSKHLRTSASQLYALKQLRKTDVIRLKQVEHVMNERTILGLCRPQPFIVDLLASWSDRECLYMLLNYCPGGEVFSYLRKNRRFDFDTTRFYAGEMTLIMEFLHDNGIVYRDLKPENILIDAEGHVKLVDFGFAKRIGEMETYTLCGTPEYLSPEVIQSQGHGTAVDWWAMGILIYEFLASPFEIYERIVAGKIAFPPWMTPATRNIISSLCTADRTSRLGNLKGGARDVKAHPFFEGIDWAALSERRTNGPIVPKLAFDGDTRYFDNYDPPSPHQERYTSKQAAEYEDYFRDF